MVTRRERVEEIRSAQSWLIPHPVWVRDLLNEVDTLRMELAAAKAEGWREAIEAAAKLADSYGERWIADAIRALLPPAPSEGGESGKVGG